MAFQPVVDVELIRHLAGRVPLSSRSLRDGGVAFVPLMGEDTCVVVLWHPQAMNPALPPLRAVLHEVAGDIDLSG